MTQNATSDQFFTVCSLNILLKNNEIETMYLTALKFEMDSSGNSIRHKWVNWIVGKILVKLLSGFNFLFSSSCVSVLKNRHIMQHHNSYDKMRDHE